MLWHKPRAIPQRDTITVDTYELKHRIYQLDEESAACYVRVEQADLDDHTRFSDLLRQYLAAARADELRELLKRARQGGA